MVKRLLLLSAALSVALAAPAHSSIIYDFVQTAEGGTYEPFQGIDIQITLGDETAGSSSIYFKQVGNGSYGPPTTIGSGVEQFGMWAIDRESFGSMTRLPIYSDGLSFEASLNALLGGGLAGSIKFFEQGDGVQMAYNQGSGLWQGSFNADYMSRCGSQTDCTFTGYFAQAVPEPATVAAFGAALLALFGWRRGFDRRRVRMATAGQAKA